MNIKKIIKCNLCKKKIKKLLPIKCKCDKYYCNIHNAEHNCNYDYKKDNQIKLEIQNPIIKHEKFERI